MESLRQISPLAVFTIAFCAVFTALGLMFNILLSPIKKDITRLETRMDRIETRMDRIESKLDQLIVLQQTKNKQARLAR